MYFLFQAEDGIRDLVRSRGLGDVYKGKFTKCSKAIMGELQYAQTSGATRIFFYVQTFIGNRTNGEESFDSHPPQRA